MNFSINYYLNVLLIRSSTKNDRCQDITLILFVICDSCDEVYFNRIFNPDATIEYP